jgi:predicted kinase
VRAKVALFRRQQLNKRGDHILSELVQEYLDLAVLHAQQLGPPLLLIVGGLMGTGKSTLADQFAGAFDVEVLSTDRLRHELLGKSAEAAAYGEGHYQPDLRERIYDELFRQAADVLETGQTVVLDGTFLTDGLRARAYDVAYRHGATAVCALCTCPRQLAYARIQQRAHLGLSESEARVELYDLQARDFEPPCADDPCVSVDTAQPMTRQMDAVCTALKSVLFH